MATKADEVTAPPKKSRKMLIIVGLLVLVLVLAGFGAFIYVNKQRAAAQFDQDEPPVEQHTPKGPPAYLPLDNMVVNLADPGGQRVAQIGITLELQDAAATERVKQYLPTIRSGILLLMSQKTSDELLQREGKEKLAKDILREASRPFGDVEEDADSDGTKNAAAPAKSKTAQKRRRPQDRPVLGVLFSSFIVQ